MVTFICDACQQSVKKPKVEEHAKRCYSCSVFSCVDCGTDFSTTTVKNHSSCMSEAEKYHGKFASGNQQQQKDKANQEKEKKEQKEKKESEAPAQPRPASHKHQDQITAADKNGSDGQQAPSVSRKRGRDGSVADEVSMPIPKKKNSIKIGPILADFIESRGGSADVDALINHALDALKATENPKANKKENISSDRMRKRILRSLLKARVLYAVAQDDGAKRRVRSQ